MMIYIRVIEALLPLTYLAGLAVAIRYFRKHGKPVFALLFLYFAFGIYSCTVAPHVNRLIRSKCVKEPTQELVEKYEAYQKESMELQTKYFPDTRTPFAVNIRTVSIPFREILLVVALFLLGKRIENKTPNKNFAGIDANPPNPQD